MVVVEICYRNFDGKKYKSLQIIHMWCNSEYLPQEIQKKKKEYPYCMPHLFFLSPVLILQQMNGLGDFERLLYGM